MTRRVAIAFSLGFILVYGVNHINPLALTFYAIALAGAGVLTLLYLERYRLWFPSKPRMLAGTDLTTIRPDDFERYTAKVIAGLGNGNWTCERVGGSGDQGIDVTIHNRLGQLVGVVQCKHRERADGSVGPSVIRDMDSTRQRHGAKIAFVVTNGRFTSGSRELAQSYGIRLLDGNDLRGLQNRPEMAGKYLPIKPLIGNLRISSIAHSIFGGVRDSNL